MQAYGGIRPERVAHGAAVRRHRHTRDLAQTDGRIVTREHPVRTITSRHAPRVGAGSWASINAVKGVGLERGTQPQTGAAYG